MSLAKAMAAFVAHGCDRTKMNVAAWCETYPPAGLETIRAAWEAAMTEASRKPQNTYDTEGK